MKIMKTREVPASTRVELDRIQCELCEAKSVDGEDWSSGGHSEDTVIVQREHGVTWHDSADVEHIILDMCPTCFHRKLIPWFEAQGGTVRTEDRGY